MIASEFEYNYLSSLKINDIAVVAGCWNLWVLVKEERGDYMETGLSMSPHVCSEYQQN